MIIFLGTGTGYWKVLNEIGVKNRLLSYYVNAKIKRAVLEKMVRSDFIIPGAEEADIKDLLEGVVPDIEKDE